LNSISWEASNVSESGKRRELGASWVDEIEAEIDHLRDVRAELRRRLSELDLEGEAIWDEQERRWRRLESKLKKVQGRRAARVDRGLATNIENLIALIDEAYGDLDSMLD